MWVTGVQTCALPIWHAASGFSCAAAAVPRQAALALRAPHGVELARVWVCDALGVEWGGSLWEFGNWKGRGRRRRLNRIELDDSNATLSPPGSSLSH